MTVPPAHEAVVDTEAAAAADATVEIDDGRAVVTIHAHDTAGVPLPERPGLESEPSEESDRDGDEPPV